MIFTYSSRKQKHIPWKPNQKVGIVRKVSKPNYNKSDPSIADDYTSKFGTARPQKHYRKQLMPYHESKTSKRVSIDDVNVPLTRNETYCDNNISNANIIHDYVLDKPEPCLGIKTEKGCVGGNTNVRRSASTNISKNYHQTTSSYLRSKCQTYNQNLTIGKQTDNDNEYNMTSCSSSKCNKTVFKPNNKPFTTQGSVSSSTRLLRLKQNTINQNGASFLNAYGRASANAGKYKNSINGETIYFDKSKDNNKSCNDLPLNFRKSSTHSSMKSTINC